MNFLTEFIFCKYSVLINKTNFFNGINYYKEKKGD